MIKINFVYLSVQEILIKLNKIIMSEEKAKQLLREFSSWVSSEYNGPDISEEIIEEFLEDINVDNI